jgi:hypothetical protein
MSRITQIRRSNSIAGEDPAHVKKGGRQRQPETIQKEPSLHRPTSAAATASAIPSVKSEQGISSPWHHQAGDNRVIAVASVEWPGMLSVPAHRSGAYTIRMSGA